MLIKEYRISLPMSVEEYRIAQLYMIQRKSREESHGTESGVEIIENKPYEDGPGGSGQYTYKIFHIGSHLPGWFRAILPKSALRVEEEAWNAYPYTKTRYKCPFIEKFLLEVETKYLNDAGEEDGVFNLSKSEKAQRTVDYIDIVKDSLSGGDYKTEEDPKLYVSNKTGRGPLTEEWRKEYSKAIASGGGSPKKEIMTAYKLCRVEFKYWGMQNKIERFIHDVALRKTMLRAHRQAWAWQDEYYGLTLSDIRALERETQLALAEKMAAAASAADSEDGFGDVFSKEAANEDKESLPSTTSANNNAKSAAFEDLSPSSNEPFPCSPPLSSQRQKQEPLFPVNLPTRHHHQQQQQQQHTAKSSVHFSSSVIASPSSRLTDSGSTGGGAEATVNFHRSTSQESTATMINGSGGIVSGGVYSSSTSSLSSLQQGRRSSKSRSSPVEKLNRNSFLTIEENTRSTTIVSKETIYDKDKKPGLVFDFEK